MVPGADSREPALAAQNVSKPMVFARQSGLRRPKRCPGPFGIVPGADFRAPAQAAQNVSRSMVFAKQTSFREPKRCQGRFGWCREPIRGYQRWRPRTCPNRWVSLGKRASVRPSGARAVSDVYLESIFEFRHWRHRTCPDRLFSQSKQASVSPRGARAVSDGAGSRFSGTSAGGPDRVQSNGFR